MKSLRFALVALLILVVVGVARANTTDPQIIIGDPTTQSQSVGSTFSFSLDPSGTAFVVFLNMSGVPWFNIEFTTATPTGTITALGGNFFTSSTILFNSNNTVSILFFGLDSTHLGILPGNEFFVNMTSSVNQVTTTWVPNATVSAVANVPEPATLALFLTGIGAFAARRRLQKQPV